MDNPYYKTKLCRNFSNMGFCSYGERCLFAHGLSDIRTINFPQGVFTVNDNISVGENLNDSLGYSKKSDKNEEDDDLNELMEKCGRKGVKGKKSSSSKRNERKSEKFNQFRDLNDYLDMIRYGPENYEIMKETGLGPEDLALNMLGWDKEDRDYAFIDEVLNEEQYSDSDGSDFY